MQWDAGPFAGFSDADSWLPLAGDYQTRNVAMQTDEPTSMLNLYRSLLRCRRSNPALLTGSYETFPSPEGCFAYLRRHLDSTRLVALNFRSEPVRIDLHSVQGPVVLSTYLDRHGYETESLNLRPDEGVILEVGP